MIKSVHHTSLTVSDLEGSLAFYRDLLGMPVIHIFESSPEFCEKITAIRGARLKIAYLDAWGHRLELIQYLSPQGRRLDLSTCNIGVAHIAFDVDNLETMYQELKARKVKFKSEPVPIAVGPNRGGFSVYLEDPDGITLEFIQPPPR